MHEPPYCEGQDYTVNPDGCWIWLGSIDVQGYGRTRRRHGRRAHRESYRRMVGPIPEGHHLHHECANKTCVNPAHLVAVTHGEHMALEAPHLAQAQTAQALRIQGMTYGDIAAVLKCGKTTAYRLVNASYADHERQHQTARRDHLREVGREYRLAPERRGTCESCGGLMGAAVEDDGICATCRTGQHRARCQKIHDLWHQGASLRDIAEALGTTRNSVGVQMVGMRKEGWDIPYRYSMRDGKRVAS